MKQQPIYLFEKPFIILGELPEDQKVLFTKYRRDKDNNTDELNVNIIPYAQYSLWYDIFFDKTL